MTASDNGERRPAAPIDCEMAVRRLWDYLDGRLPAIAHDEVEAHLAVCARCPSHFTFARTMQRALATPPAGHSLADRDAQLRERVRAALARLANTRGGGDRA